MSILLVSNKRKHEWMHFWWSFNLVHKFSFAVLIQSQSTVGMGSEIFISQLAIVSFILRKLPCFFHVGDNSLLNITTICGSRSIRIIKKHNEICSTRTRRQAPAFRYILYVLLYFWRAWCHDIRFSFLSFFFTCVFCLFRSFFFVARFFFIKNTKTKLSPDICIKIIRFGYIKKKKFEN